MIRAPPRSTRTYTLFPYTTLFRSTVGAASAQEGQGLTLDKPAKIAMLYISPRNDGGWTQAFDEARQKLETELDTEIQYVESVPENASSRSEEHTSELQSLMRISYAVFCLNKKKTR